jgi:indole-3-glycerol phosphate synthase
VIDFIEKRHVVVSESGITAPADLARLRNHGVNIVLVGEFLLRQPDPGQALRELLRNPAIDG